MLAQKETASSVGQQPRACFLLLVSTVRGRLHLQREIIWMAGSLQIRGMSIDEAIAQLEFNDKKGAKIMKEV